MNKQFLDSVECYDPIHDIWHSIGAMKKPRSFPGAVLFKEHIYVIGGTTPSGDTVSVERYDFTKKDWEMVTTKL